MLLATYFLLALHVSGQLLSNYRDIHFLDGKKDFSHFFLFFSMTRIMMITTAVIMPIPNNTATKKKFIMGVGVGVEVGVGVVVGVGVGVGVEVGVGVGVGVDPGDGVVS